MDCNRLEGTGMNWTTLEYTRLKQKEKTLLDIPVDSSGIHLNPSGIDRAHESTGLIVNTLSDVKKKTLYLQYMLDRIYRK